jgi:nucleoid-associated protein YgaU
MYQRGKLRLSQGRPEEALTAFLNVIDRRKTAPESHFEAAEIYLEYLKDPVSAIYHYRRYLEFLPDSPEAGVVRQRIESAQKDFARQLPAEPFQGARDRLDLMELLDSVREENTNLKRQLLAAQERIESLESRLGITPSTPNRETVAGGPRLQPSPNSPGGGSPAQGGTAAAGEGRTYTVVAGDTLVRISQKVYDTQGRWMDIYQANRDTLDSPNALRPGQVLRIP